MKLVQYQFIGKGSVVSKNAEYELLRPKGNRIFLDVGNSLDYEEGIIDNHQFDSTKYEKAGKFSSIASYCYHNENKIKKYLEKIESNDIEVVVHKDPDIDCFLSAYIIGKYLKAESLPSDINILIECVEEIDAGRLEFKNSKPINPCFIVYAIGEVVKEEIKKFNKENASNGIELSNYDERAMTKGVQLIETILKELESLPANKKTLDNIDLAKKTDSFKRELDLLSNDYESYINDYNDPEICEIGKIKLPLKNSCDNEIREVDALFWNRIPRCKLHKYWARQDKQAPLGEGYVFTFIPSATNVDAGENENDSINKEKFKGVKINKVIISVNPNSDVCLKGLGESLEKAERESERKYFNEKNDIWRSRTKSRFPEEWCDNEDPWYDGRNFDYTIVDAPKVGSLLSLKEIRHIVNNFSVPIVGEYLTRLIIPFEIDQKCYKNLCSELLKRGKQKKESSKVEDYFNTYIKTYLFENYSPKNHKDNCNHYSIKHNILTNSNMLTDEYSNSLSISNEDINFIIFKYGIGFIYFDIQISKEKGCLHFDDILHVNYRLNDTENQKCIFDKVFTKDESNKYDMKKKKLMIYSGVSIKSNILYEEKHKEMIYKLMNFVNWQGADHNSRYMEYLTSSDIIRANENIYYGFNKNGGTMLIIDDNFQCAGNKSCRECNVTDLSLKQKCINKKNNEAIHKYFGEIDFYIFILALQQKLTLLEFSNKLAEYDKKRNKKNIEKLRSLLLNFTTQGWFTEITEDKIGTEFYKKWTEVFENKELYNEVYEQLSSVDDYYKSRLSSKYTSISTIAFPMIFIGSVGSIFSTGYIKNSGNIMGFKWIPSSDGIMGAFSLGWLWFCLFCLGMFLFFIWTFYKES